MSGTSASVFGSTTPSTGGNTTALIGFAVDGVPYNNFIAPQNSPVIKHLQYFHVEGLSSDTEHTIEMSSLSENNWYLDYFVYTTQSSSRSSVNDTISQGTGGNTEGNGNTGSNDNVGGQQSGDNTGAQGTVGASNKPSPGVIAGAVIATLLGVIAIIAIILLLRRKRKTQDPVFVEEKSTAPNTPGPFAVTSNPSSPDAFTSTTPEVHQIPVDGLIPATKDIRAGGNSSRTALLNAGPSSVYSGLESSIQSNSPMSETPSTEPSSYDGQQPELLWSPSGRGYSHS